MMQSSRIILLAGYGNCLTKLKRNSPGSRPWGSYQGLGSKRCYLINKRKKLEKFIKTANQVVIQIERWFLLYHRKEKSAFNGTEPFTIFNHLYFETQNTLIKRMNLNAQEIPVLALTAANDGFVVTTTQRFIHIHDSGTESLFYSDFEMHRGFRFYAVQPSVGKISNIKKDGSFEEFGLKKRDGEVLYWLLPTGQPGFAFWNVTNKCELIGRK